MILTAFCFPLFHVVMWSSNKVFKWKIISHNVFEMFAPFWHMSYQFCWRSNSNILTFSFSEIRWTLNELNVYPWQFRKQTFYEKVFSFHLCYKIENLALLFVLLLSPSFSFRSVSICLSALIFMTHAKLLRKHFSIGDVPFDVALLELNDLYDFHIILS